LVHLRNDLNPELILNGLRFLLDGYKTYRERFKDKKTPDRVEEIVIRAEKETADIERSLDALEPSDAAIVRGDLELLSLLISPTPSMDAFDYWGKLTILVEALQRYATDNRLFELRGSKMAKLGEVLALPRSAKIILPAEHARKLAVVSTDRERLKDVYCVALLQKEPQGFPIAIALVAQFNHYESMGGVSVRETSCRFSISAGQQRHWLMFSRPEDWFMPDFKTHYEYRLGADDLISVAQALREDIGNYVSQVSTDQEKIAPLFFAIDVFASGAATKPS
jgi:hypothetical protein